MAEDKFENAVDLCVTEDVTITADCQKIRFKDASLYSIFKTYLEKSTKEEEMQLVRLLSARFNDEEQEVIFGHDAYLPQIIHKFFLEVGIDYPLVESGLPAYHGRGNSVVNVARYQYIFIPEDIIKKMQDYRSSTELKDSDEKKEDEDEDNAFFLLQVTERQEKKVERQMLYLNVTRERIDQAFDMAYKVYGFHILSRKPEIRKLDDCMEKLYDFFTSTTGEKNKNSLKFLVLQNLVVVNALDNAEAERCIDAAIFILRSRLRNLYPIKFNELSADTIKEMPFAAGEVESKPSLEDVQVALENAFKRYTGARFFFNKPDYLKNLQPDNYLQAVLMLLDSQGGIDRKSLKYLFVSALYNKKADTDQAASELIASARSNIASIVEEELDTSFQLVS